MRKAFLVVEQFEYQGRVEYFALQYSFDNLGDEFLDDESLDG